MIFMNIFIPGMVIKTNVLRKDTSNKSATMKRFDPIIITLLRKTIESGEDKKITHPTRNRQMPVSLVSSLGVLI